MPFNLLLCWSEFKLKKNKKKTRNILQVSFSMEYREHVQSTCHLEYDNVLIINTLELGMSSRTNLYCSNVLVHFVFVLNLKIPFVSYLTSLVVGNSTIISNSRA